MAFRWYLSCALVASYFAYNTVPTAVPYQPWLEYMCDLGAFHLVDFPFHHQLPNPFLRLLFTVYSFAAFYLLHLLVRSVCSLCCCSNGNACSSHSSSSDASAACYIRTDVYASLVDAQRRRRPISSQIIKVDSDTIAPVALGHNKDD